MKAREKSKRHNSPAVQKIEGIQSRVGITEWLKRTIEECKNKRTLRAHMFMRKMPRDMRRGDERKDLQAISQALARLAEKGYLTRASVGVYDVAGDQPDPGEVKVRSILVELMANLCRRCRRYGHDPLDIMCDAEERIVDNGSA